MLLDWRLYTKLRSTYVEALPLLHRPDHRAPAHHVPAGGGGDRAALLGRSQPAEHPHPHGARPAHPQRLRGGRRGPRAAGGRLQPDRAARPGPRLGRRAPPRGLRAARRHPPRDRGPGPQEGPGGRHRRRALDGQDGQLRPGLRHERLRAGHAGGHPARRGAGLHRVLLRGLQRHRLLHAAHRASWPASRATSRRCWAGAAGSRSWRRATRSCAAPASAWPSTCPSRARPRTS